MATAPKSVETSSAISRRNDVMIGTLPDGFLRVPNTDETTQQINNDEMVAMALQQQQYSSVTQHNAANIKGRLDVTIVEAKLVKNYGVTRMDPYVRLRIGHHVFETRTCYNGAKNPKWNKVFHCFLPHGVESFHVEIFDECSFTVDEMIAWTLFKIPESVMKGETMEEWIPLNGKQGDGKEGNICIVVSYTPMSRATTVLPNVPNVYPVSTAPMVIMPNPYGVVYGQPNIPQVYIQPGHVPAPPQPVVIRDEDVQQVHEMFPNIEIDVIKTIMETERGNKDRAINSLLQLTNESN